MILSKSRLRVWKWFPKGFSACTVIISHVTFVILIMGRKLTEMKLVNGPKLYYGAMLMSTWGTGTEAVLAGGAA